MSIILKNNLDTLVTYATNVPSGSGIVSPNGRTRTLPNGTTTVFWTVDPNARAGSFQGSQFGVKDGFVYTICIETNPI